MHRLMVDHGQLPFFNRGSQTNSMPIQKLVAIDTHSAQRSWTSLVGEQLVINQISKYFQVLLMALSLAVGNDLLADSQNDSNCQVAPGQLLQIGKNTKQSVQDWHKRED